MALTAYTLTVETVDLHGADLSGVEVSVVVSNVALYTGGTPTEHVIPSTLGSVTNASGVATFQLLPSSIVGTYDVTVGGFTRTITMPAANARLSGLGDSVAPEEALELLDTRLARLAGDLSGDEQSGIATKLGLAAGMDKYVSAATLSNANLLTFTLMNGTDFSVDLSSLSDTLTDTNTYVTGAALATNGTLTLTLSDASTVTVDLSELQTDEPQVTIIKAEIAGGLNGVFDALSVGDTVYITKSGTTTVEAETIFKSRRGSRVELHIENSDLSNFLSGNVLIRTTSETGTTIVLANDRKTSEANLTNSGDYIITEDVETGGLDLWRLLHEIEADLQADIDTKANNSTLSLNSGTNILTLTDTLGNTVTVDLSALVTTDTDTTNMTLALGADDNVLTLTDSEGNTVTADLSQLVDTFTDTNTYVSAATLGSDNTLTLTVTGGTDVTVDLSGLAGMSVDLSAYQVHVFTLALPTATHRTNFDMIGGYGSTLQLQKSGEDNLNTVVLTRHRTSTAGTIVVAASADISSHNSGNVNFYAGDPLALLFGFTSLQTDIADVDAAGEWHIAENVAAAGMEAWKEIARVFGLVPPNRYVSAAALSGTTLTLTVANGTNVTVDLAALDTDTDTDTTNSSFSFDSATNILTLTDSATNTVTIDLSALSDSFTDTNTTLSSATLGTDNTLTLTLSDASTVTVDLSGLAGGGSADLSDYEVRDLTFFSQSTSGQQAFDGLATADSPTITIEHSGQPNTASATVPVYASSRSGNILKATVGGGSDLTDVLEGAYGKRIKVGNTTLGTYSQTPESSAEEVTTASEWHVGNSQAAAGDFAMERIDGKSNTPTLLAWHRANLRGTAASQIDAINGTPFAIPATGSLAIAVTQASDAFVGTGIFPCSLLRSSTSSRAGARITDSRSLFSRDRNKAQVAFYTADGIMDSGNTYDNVLHVYREQSLPAGQTNFLIYHIEDVFDYPSATPGTFDEADTNDKWSDDAEDIFDRVQGSFISSASKQTDGTWRRDYQASDGFYTVTGLDENNAWVTTAYDADDDSQIARRVAARPSTGVWNISYESLLTP